MRAYRHKHVLRHASTILTSRNGVSEKAWPFFVCRYMHFRGAIPVGGHVPLRLPLCILPLIVCSSIAAWWSPPYPWTCLQVLGRCRDGRLSFEFPKYLIPLGGRLLDCGPCARGCRNVMSSLLYYITTQAATQAVTKGHCIAVGNRSNRSGGHPCYRCEKCIHRRKYQI